MAIHLDVSQTRLHFVLQGAYRVLAVVWLVKGFWGWASLVGAVGPGLHVFQAAFDTEMTLRVIFSVLDLVAGVALWMSWRWGAGVWFLVATAYGLSALALPTELAVKFVGVMTLLLVTIHLLRIFFVRAQPEKRLTIV